MSFQFIGGVILAAALAFSAPAGAATPTDPSCNGDASSHGQTATFVQNAQTLIGPGFAALGPQGVATVVHGINCPAGK